MLHFGKSKKSFFKTNICGKLGCKCKKSAYKRLRPESTPVLLRQPIIAPPPSPNNWSEEEKVESIEDAEEGSASSL